MLTDGLDRIIRETDSLTNPARQALNAMVRCSLEKSANGKFSVTRTRKYKGAAAPVELNFILDGSNVITLVSMDGTSSEKFASISVGDTITGNGIPENAVVSSIGTDSIIMSAEATIESSSEQLEIAPELNDSDLNASLRGAEEIELTLERWMLVILHDFFEKWADGQYSAEAFDDLIVEDNIADSSINTILPYGKTPVIGSVNESGITVIKTPATRALVMLSRIINGEFENLADYPTVSEIFSLNLGEDGLPISKEEFVTSDDIVEFAGNFASGNVAYWLFKIRNSNNNRQLGEMAPEPLQIRTPLYNKYLGVDGFDGNLPYVLPYDVHSKDHLGYYGDSIERDAGGYSWDIATEHLSIGVDNQADGMHSAVIGSGTLAGDFYNSAFNTSTQCTDIYATAFGKGTIAGEMPYAFLNGIYDPTMDIEISCVDCEQVMTLEGLALDTAGLDITISIPATSLGYVVGDKLTLYNSLDENGNRRAVAVVATILTDPIEVAKNDGSGYKTLVQLSFDSDVVGSFRSGWAARRWNATTENMTRFVAGQYNKPNQYSIFQIGTAKENSIGHRDTRLEVGFANGNWTERYFKFGLDSTNSQRIDNVFVGPDQIQFSVGGDYKNKIYLSGNEAIVEEGINDSGSIKLAVENSEGYVKFASATDSTYVKITNEQIYISTDGKSALTLRDDSLTMSADNNIYFGTLTGNVSIESAGQLSINSNGQMRFEYSDTAIYANALEINASSISASVGYYYCHISDSFDLLLSNSTSVYQISGSTLSIYGDVTIGNNNPVIFSKNCNNGSSHSLNPTGTSGASGILEISTAGFHFLNSTPVTTLEDSNYIMGTKYNMVPDTNTSTYMNNYCIMNVHNDDWKWAIAMSAHVGEKRVWTATQAAGSWENWRSFTYYDEIDGFGMTKDYEYELIKFQDSDDGSSVRMGVITTKDACDLPIENAVVSSSDDKTGTTTLWTKYDKVPDADKVLFSNFEFSKIGYTIFFRIKLTFSGKINMGGRGLMMLINDKYSELTPISVDSESLSGGRNRTFRFLSSAVKTNWGYNAASTYELTIRKFRSTGTSFVITRNHDFPTLEFDAGEIIEFTGHYYCDNNEQLM